jgi:hypothetical protein
MVQGDDISIKWILKPGIEKKKKLPNNSELGFKSI